MSEEFLQYIWSQELFEKNVLSVSGEEIEVLHPGMKNTDAGPDFTNSRIKIDGTIWAGNVEIHTTSDLWDKHKHQEDAAYNNVILHVVDKYTKQAVRKNGEAIPCIELKYNKHLLENYRQIIHNQYKIPCQNDLGLVNGFTISNWLNSLFVERLKEKSEGILQVLKYTKSGWEETFYIVMARNFGFGTNGLPFELLAKNTPLKILARHHNSNLQIEAVLMGQAGLIPSEPEDEFSKEMLKEYKHLRKLYNLNPVESHLWKFLRLRPVSFPTIRISQFANLIWRSTHLFSKIIEVETIQELDKLLVCEASEYWNNKYLFAKETTQIRKKALGSSSRKVIIINTIIPFLFVYGKERDKKELMDKALSLMEELPPEDNSVVNNWIELGISPKNALESQALIQLTKLYCAKKNCLYCQIGNRIIRSKIDE
ncbi:MAG: DUF2851 family protein [Bacteroidales bacterium]|nr:DUF2851 family protein [Bacteroidales bacterium]MBN2819135.1 DUF2851 family protein [Bacteroidales bacterium]